VQVYAGPLKGGARAVVLFNRHSPDYRYNNMTVTWEQLGYDATEAAVVRDMFLQEDLGEYTGEAFSVVALKPSTRQNKLA
jgi:alpha-galactosidase